MAGIMEISTDTLIGGKRERMRQPANMCRIYNMISSNMGKRVVVRENHGRNKTDVAEGIIEEMHPHVFCVRVDGDLPETAKKVSYSYTDVLIKDVELVFSA